MCYFLTDFLNYFDIKELIQLSLTCKEYNKSITKDRANYLISDKIIDRIKKYVEDYDEFVKFMTATNAFISGSFIIQSILDEYYEYSDMDIYIPFRENELRTTYNFKNFEIERDSTQYDLDCEVSPLEIYRVVDYLSPELEEYSMKGRNRLQLIYLKIDPDRQSIINHLSKYFDFDICKNFFRFNDIYIKNLFNIVDKQLNFHLPDNDNWPISKTIDRAQKYRERGFNIVNHCSVTDFIDNSDILIHQYLAIPVNQSCSLYQLIDGNSSLLSVISEFVYLNKFEKNTPKYQIYSEAPLFEGARIELPPLFRSEHKFLELFLRNGSFESEILDEKSSLGHLDDKTTYKNAIRVYCDFCHKYTWLIYNESLNYYVCTKCIKRNQILDKSHHYIKETKDDKIVHLSDKRRNTCIDYYVNFCYPEGNTRIYWNPENSQELYLFVINK